MRDFFERWLGHYTVAELVRLARRPARFQSSLNIGFVTLSLVVLLHICGLHWLFSGFGVIDPSFFSNLVGEQLLEFFEVTFPGALIVITFGGGMLILPFYREKKVLDDRLLLPQSDESLILGIWWMVTAMAFRGWLALVGLLALVQLFTWMPLERLLVLLWTSLFLIASSAALGIWLTSRSSSLLPMLHLWWIPTVFFGAAPFFDWCRPWIESSIANLGMPSAVIAWNVASGAVDSFLRAINPYAILFLSRVTFLGVLIPYALFHSAITVWLLRASARRVRFKDDVRPRNFVFRRPPVWDAAMLWREMTSHSAILGRFTFQWKGVLLLAAVGGLVVLFGWSIQAAQVLLGWIPAATAYSDLSIVLLFITLMVPLFTGIIGVLSASVAVAKERSSSDWDCIRLSLLTGREILLSKLVREIAQYFGVLIILLPLLFYCWSTGGVRVGSWLQFQAFLLLGAIAFTAFGLWIGTATRDYRRTGYWLTMTLLLGILMLAALRSFLPWSPVTILLALAERADIRWKSPTLPLSLVAIAFWVVAFAALTALSLTFAIRGFKERERRFADQPR